MAEELSENAKRELEAGREARDRSMKEFVERTKGKPTPTQEENDRARLGEHITEHEPDGTPEEEQTRTLESTSHRGGYQTRQTTPQQSGGRQQQHTPPRPPSGGSSS